MDITCSDAIVATQWYPFASSSAPDGFCFATSIRGAPVRLIDGFTGRVRFSAGQSLGYGAFCADVQTRATYPIVDHRERFIAPHSLAFSPSGVR